MRLEDLIVRQRIEEDNRMSEKKIGSQSMVFKANMVEQVEKINKKSKSSRNYNKKDSKKFNGKRFICNKPRHRAKDCHQRNNQGNFKKRKTDQANMTEVENLSEDIFEMNLSAIISEVNLVNNPK